jgi:predicted DNA-binding transcriptional regulator YafY
MGRPLRCFAKPDSPWATMKKTSQLARQLQLIDRLRSPRGCTVNRLAADLECSRRTIFRDLKALEAAGIDVLMEKDAETCYLLAPHYGLIPPSLTPEDCLALALAIGTTPVASNSALSGILEAALAKIMSKLPMEQREQIVRVVKACRLETADLDNRQIGILRKFIMALATAEELRVDSQRDDGSWLVHDRVRPVSLHLEGGQWALAYRGSGQGEVVLVPLARIIDLKPADPKTPNFSRHFLVHERSE